MFSAIARAAGQMTSGPILTLLGASVLLAVGCFVLTFVGIDFALDHWLGDRGVLSELLGGALTVVLAWFLFPIVTAAFVGLFLERVATVVERQHYPQLPTAPGLPFVQALVGTGAFLVTLLSVNALLLVLLPFPPLYVIAAPVLNGFLIGREYFELVALRRLDRSAARALRERHAGELLLTGIVVTLLLALPLVNLVTPVFVTAVMVHRYHDWQRTQAGGGVQAGGG